MERIDAAAEGTLMPGVERRITLCIHEDGPLEGQTDEGALLAALQDAGLVSDDVRGIYSEASTDGVLGETVLTVMDVDTDDTVAWVRVPWMANGADGDLAAMMREYDGDAAAVSDDLDQIGARLAHRDDEGDA